MVYANIVLGIMETDYPPDSHLQQGDATNSMTKGLLLPGTFFEVFFWFPIHVGCCSKSSLIHPVTMWEIWTITGRSS
jgi:hypothetical protein